MLRKISIANAAIHPLVKAWPDDKLGDIYEKLCKHNSVVVVDTTGQFKGIISRKNVVKEMISRSDWKETPIANIMTTRVLHVPNHVSLAEAAEIMLDSDIHQLVVTGPPEGGSVAIGILTLEDVVRNAV
jgi:signal-transduction protein with cAMP-binding, CBS, and nucleotidyltransferase domain